jgi:HAMP domain-containing protein
MPPIFGGILVWIRFRIFVSVNRARRVLRVVWSDVERGRFAVKIVRKRPAVLRLRRRVQGYQHMRDEIDALKREIERQRK